MSKKKYISLFQFSTLLIIFNLGTAIIICPEIYFAGKMGWVSDIVAMFMGVISVIILLLLHYPDYRKNLVEIVADFGGRITKTIIALIYIFYTIHLGALSLRIIANFLSMVIMPNMPQIIFTSILTLVAAYAVMMGIETIGRLGQIILPVVGAIFLLLLLLAIPEYEPKNLLPLQGQLRNILKGAYTIWAFPLGNLFLFTFILPYVKIKKKKKKTRFYITSFTIILLTSGFFLTLRTVALSLVLGSDLVPVFSYPIFSMVGVIEVANFLERLEVAFLIMWIGTVFINILVCYWIAVEGVGIICNSKKTGGFVIPIGVIMVGLAKILFKNYSEQYLFTIKIWPLYATIFILIIPLFILMVKYVYNIIHRQI